MSAEVPQVEKQEEVVLDLTNPEVTTKYTTAAEICNKALTTVIELCVDGADVFELCEAGDAAINDATGKVYNKRPKGEKDEKETKKMEKGVAFPTCVSVNEIGGLFSPLKAESRALKKGDVAKIDLGVHIDGFIVQGSHTIVVGNEKVNDRRADVMKAAFTGAEAAVRTIQVGNTNTQVTEVIQKVADEFKCQPVHGVLSHEVKRHVIHGKNVILSKETDDHKVNEFEFEPNTVYVMDVMMSTGDGKMKEQECRTCVYKRAVETQYLLKTQKARQFISEINKKYPVLPFSLRCFGDEQCAKVGVTEAKRHELVNEFPVMAERHGEFVAQVKFTVLLLPGGTKKVTGLSLDMSNFESQHEVQDEDLKKLLAQSVAPRKKRNKAKKDDKAE